MRIASDLGLSPVEQGATFYGLLMKDAGCSSNAAAVAALYGTDDISAKRAFRTVNYSCLSEALGYIAGNVGGARDLVRVLRAGKASARTLTEVRCERGAQIARMLELPEGAAAAIGSLGEHWNGKGHPVGLAGEEIPLLARVFKLAQTTEVFVRDFGVDVWTSPSVRRRCARVLGSAATRTPSSSSAIETTETATRGWRAMGRRRSAASSRRRPASTGPGSWPSERRTRRRSGRPTRAASRASPAGRADPVRRRPAAPSRRAGRR